MGDIPTRGYIDGCGSNCCEVSRGARIINGDAIPGKVERAAQGAASGQPDNVASVVDREPGRGGEYRRAVGQSARRNINSVGGVDRVRREGALVEDRDRAAVVDDAQATNRGIQCHSRRDVVQHEPTGRDRRAAERRVAERAHVAQSQNRVW